MTASAVAVPLQFQWGAGGFVTRSPSPPFRLGVMEARLDHASANMPGYYGPRRRPRPPRFKFAFVRPGAPVQVFAVKSKYMQLQETSLARGAESPSESGSNHHSLHILLSGAASLTAP